MSTNYLPKNIDPKTECCLTCILDYLLCEHRKESEEREKQRSMALRNLPSAKESTIAHLIARHELESDEFQTREQKAERLYKAGVR